VSKASINGKVRNGSGQGVAGLMARLLDSNGDLLATTVIRAATPSREARLVLGGLRYLFNNSFVC
jgi:hypothetical protein